MEKNIWWKIYFWFNALSFIPYTYASVPVLLSFSLTKWVGFTVEAIALVGLYAFVFEKKVWTKNFWQIFFWSTLIFITVRMLTRFISVKTLAPVYGDMTISNLSVLVLFIGILLSIPHYYALYKLGYTEKKPKKKTPNKKRK